MPIVLSGLAGSQEPAHATSLMLIEQEVAARVGPYMKETATGGTVSTLVCANLQSSAEVGGPENLYLLRRGRNADGTAVTSFVAADRVRLVRDYAPNTGTLTPDRVWAHAPVDGEVFELHHLHPQRQLRPAVLSGLRRCYLVERLVLSLPTTGAERDLTALAGWIKEPAQVYEVYVTGAGETALPAPAHWWRATADGDRVRLAIWPDPYPGTLVLSCRRPADSLVNGLESTTGPTLDADAVGVALDYAASAGHVECWRRWRVELTAASGDGAQAGQQEAAVEFTLQARRHFKPPLRRVMLAQPFGGTVL